MESKGQSSMAVPEKLEWWKNAGKKAFASANNEAPSKPERKYTKRNKNDNPMHVGQSTLFAFVDNTSQQKCFVDETCKSLDDGPCSDESVSLNHRTSGARTESEQTPAESTSEFPTTPLLSRVSVCESPLSACVSVEEEHDASASVSAIVAADSMDYQNEVE